MTEQPAIFEPPTAAAEADGPRLLALRKVLATHPPRERYQPGVAILESLFRALDLAEKRGDPRLIAQIATSAHRLASDFQFVPDPDTPLPDGSEAPSASALLDEIGGDPEMTDDDASPLRDTA